MYYDFSNETRIIAVGCSDEKYNAIGILIRAIDNNIPLEDRVFVFENENGVHDTPELAWDDMKFDKYRLGMHEMIVGERIQTYASRNYYHRRIK
jgi:hypothetical protein